MTDDDGYFGERVAARYDESSGEMFAPAAVDPAVGFLAGLAGDGRALELGIGTGRIALPLGGARGVPVHGIDLSRAMVARLRAKPGGGAEDIGVSIGDFATTKADGEVLPRLPDLQHDHEPDDAGRPGRLLPQRRGHLSPGGCFVIEVMVPELRKLPAGHRLVPFQDDPDALGVRRARRCHSGRELQRRRGRGRPWFVPGRSLPVRVAGRTRPDGTARGPTAARSVGGLGPVSRSRTRADAMCRSGRSPCYRPSARRGRPRHGGRRPPARRETAYPSSARSSGVSFSAPAAMFSSRWSGEPVPEMSGMFGDLAGSQAGPPAGTVAPRRAATASRRRAVTGWKPPTGKRDVRDAGLGAGVDEGIVLAPGDVVEVLDTGDRRDPARLGELLGRDVGDARVTDQALLTQGEQSLQGARPRAIVE